MRDIILTLLVFGSLPLILRKPFFGVLVWVWLGLMSPHRLCWGFAQTLPFSEFVAIALLLGFLFSKDPKRMPWTPLSTLLAMWWIWILIASLGADFGDPWEDFARFSKIILLTFVIMSLANSRCRLDALVWTAVLSIGFYAVKGGLFTVLTGGSNRVWGPPGSFIAGNNELGLAMIMTVPLMRYLQLRVDRALLKHGMTVAMVLTFIAILGTQSRGALVGLLCMSAYLLLKSRNKIGLLLLLLLLVPVAFLFMPESWHSRMDTIQNYEQDASAMARINVWWTAWYSVLDHPITGSGAGMWTRALFDQYAPDASVVLDVHSIYFRALAETGFVGLFLFLAVGWTTLIDLSHVSTYAASDKRLTWMRDLASMVFVAVVGYAASGAFLGLMAFDYYYLMVAIAVALMSLKALYIAAGVPDPVGAESQAGAHSEPLPNPEGRRFHQPRRKRSVFGFDVVSWYRTL